MIKSKMLFKVGTSFVAIASAVAFSTVSAIAADSKPAIEVVTHAGAGGGTDVNSRIQAVGYDNKNRKQYIYNKNYIEEQSEIKFLEDKGVDQITDFITGIRA